MLRCTAQRLTCDDLREPRGLIEVPTTLWYYHHCTREFLSRMFEETSKRKATSHSLVSTEPNACMPAMTISGTKRTAQAAPRQREVCHTQQQIGKRRGLSYPIQSYPAWQLSSVQPIQCEPHRAVKRGRRLAAPRRQSRSQPRPSRRSGRCG